MDVIALHAAGFENAVATLGTAITPEQARIFAKYTKKVVICYDADNAGQNAAQKAMRLLGEVGIEVRVLKLSGAKDPDEYIKKFGVEAFRRVLGESKSGFDYNLEKIASAYDLSLPEEKIKASADVCAIISGAYAEVEREIYIKRAAERLEISEEALRRDVERARRARVREAKQKESQEAQLSVKNIGDRVNPDAAKHIRATSAEEALLGLMLIFDEFRRAAADKTVPICAEDFVTDFSRRVFVALCELESSEAGFSKAMLGQMFDVDEMGRIEKIEIDRRRLARNDRDVFLACIDGIKEEKAKLEQTADEDPFADLKRKQEELKNNKKDKNT